MSIPTSDERSLRGTITAVDLAIHEEDYENAEKACLQALGEIRKRKSEAAQGGRE